MKKRWVSLLTAAALFVLLTVFSSAARDGAAAGLRLWATLLVPSLLPFFAAAGLLTRLGLPELLGTALSPVLGRALGQGPAGCSLLVLGLSGGYPLGAVSAAEMVREGRLTRREAEGLLRFCDNTGPAFAVGALGVGVFRSAFWGLALWGVHVFCALGMGILFRPARQPESAPLRPSPPQSPGSALTGALSGAVSALLNIGGYVTFFSALLSVAGEFGFPDRAAEGLARLSGGEAQAFRALLSGSLELSGGIGAMAGLPPTPGNLALASWLLGWGGLCVHLQSTAVTAEAGLDMKGRLWGKLLHGVLSAGVMYIVASAARCYAPPM